MLPSLDIFVARPDGALWPVPGVYGAKSLLTGQGVATTVHDTFLGLTPQIIALHLQKATALGHTSVSWGAIFLAPEVFPEGSPVPSRRWLKSINDQIAAIRMRAPQTKWCVIGYQQSRAGFVLKDALCEADLVLSNGYEAFLELPSVFGLARGDACPVYGLRKLADHLPANGFIWRSIYQMIDTQRCIGVCANCRRGDEPELCGPMHEVERLPLQAMFKEVADELRQLPAPFNLSFAENPLTISQSKFDLFSRSLKSANLPERVELHHEANLYIFTRVPNWQSFMRRHRWGSCHFTLSACGATGQRAMGFPVSSVAETLAEVRRCVGDHCYLIATLLVGLPGDSFTSMESSIRELQEIVDCLNVYPISIMGKSKLAGHEGYQFDESIRDRWGYPVWSLPNLSSIDLSAWREEWHASQLADPAYRNYRQSPDVLFASNEGFSSDRIRCDLVAAAEQPDSAGWLTERILERRQTLFSKYLAHYG